YLKRLPACELKIDRAFVKELSGESEDATIVSAIVALAKTLNLKVVAEGVETAAQQTFLTELGCNTPQPGYNQAWFCFMGYRRDAGARRLFTDQTLAGYP
ncbi:EAL domain-containing protein, partial [Escherichia coli]|uniref:EAL domain-containing protein n=1 Tax=Escherichia coli TaxID=562 RepID=UPI003BA39625